MREARRLVYLRRVLLAATVLRVVLSGGCFFTVGDSHVASRPAPRPTILLGIREEPPLDPTPPPCVGEFCQPRVAIPGWRTNVDARAGGNGLFIAIAERLQLGPISTAARIVGQAGLRVEYRPTQPGLLARDPARGGRFMVGFRWRLDPWNGPGWIPLLTGPSDDP